MTDDDILATAVWLPLHALRGGMLTCFGVAGAAACFGFLADGLVRVRSNLATHQRFVGGRLRYLRLRVPARTVVGFQLILLSAALVCGLAGVYVPAVLFIVPLVSLRPVLVLLCSRRTQCIEGQLDHWLFGLAATLRITPALGQAIEHSATLVGRPLRDELLNVGEDLALGVSVDDALRRMADRIGSRTVRSAIGAMRIGRTTGGALPELLERSAGVLREMARLEGVFRTKTAEGRAQASVVSVMPFALLALLHNIDPTFMAPLFSTGRGHLVLACAFGIWCAQLAVARKILHVDY
jgi:tight adherence protein B